MKAPDFKYEYKPPRQVLTKKGEDITEEWIALSKIKPNITILLDENCLHLRDILKFSGYTVETVLDVLDVLSGNRSILDEQIFRYALKENVFLVTKDRELKDNCMKNRIPCISLSDIFIEVQMIKQHLKYTIEEKKKKELKSYQCNI